MRCVLLELPDGSRHEVELSGAPEGARHVYTAHLPGGALTAEVTWQGHGAGRLRFRDRVLPFHVHRDGAQIAVWLAGRTYRLSRVARTAQRTADRASGPRVAELRAPMPGSVLKIHVAVGESFAAHAPLVIMESMKMELPLSLPHGGRVGAVLSREGQMVELGAVLLRLEDEDDADAT